MRVMEDNSSGPEDAQHLVKVISMQKMLLERLLIKKELKLMKLEKELRKGGLELARAEAKLSSYESVTILRYYRKIVSTCQYWKTSVTSWGVPDTWTGQDIDYGLACIIILYLGQQWVHVIPLSVSFL